MAIIMNINWMWLVIGLIAGFFVVPKIMAKVG